MNPPPGFLFCPRGRELIEFYLVPKALHGVRACQVADGIDVFCSSPDALPFVQPREAACGYFFAAHPAGERTPVPGGCWLLYGAEKEYRDGSGVEVLAFRRRFVFHLPFQYVGDFDQIWAQTGWKMKEYRLNKGAAAFRNAQHHPGANMDCVVRKVFAKQLVPPPLPTHELYSSDDQENTDPGHPSMKEEACGYGGEGQPKKRARIA